MSSIVCFQSRINPVVGDMVSWNFINLKSRLIADLPIQIAENIVYEIFYEGEQSTDRVMLSVIRERASIPTWRACSEAECWWRKVSQDADLPGCQVFKSMWLPWRICSPEKMRNNLTEELNMRLLWLQSACEKCGPSLHSARDAKHWMTFTLDISGLSLFPCWPWSCLTSPVPPLRAPSAFISSS